MSGAITAYKCETCGKISEAARNPNSLDSFKTVLAIETNAGPPSYFPPIGWFTISYQDAYRLSGYYYVCSGDCSHLLVNMLAAGIEKASA
jgi:hypothetical protein